MKKGEFNYFKCATCNNENALDHKEFLLHLESVHNIKTCAPIKKSMTMHMDAKDFYETHYLWESGDVKFYQFVRLKRNKSDPMRHA